MNLSLAELATLVGGKLITGDPATPITGFASLKEARQGDLSFFHDVRYVDQLARSKATAVMVPDSLTTLPEGMACVVVSDPSRSFEQVVEKFGFQPAPFAPGVHETAVIHGDVPGAPALEPVVFFGLGGGPGGGGFRLQEVRERRAEG